MTALADVAPAQAKGEAAQKIITAFEEQHARRGDPAQARRLFRRGGLDG